MFTVNFYGNLPAFKVLNIYSKLKVDGVNTKKKSFVGTCDKAMHDKNM